MHAIAHQLGQLAVAALEHPLDVNLSDLLTAASSYLDFSKNTIYTDGQLAARKVAYAALDHAVFNTPATRNQLAEAATALRMASA